jgi:V/A-type H+/Na+-transporting ATPase subunit K
METNWTEVLAYLGLGMLGLGLSGSAIGLAIGGSAVTGMRAERRNNGLAVSVLPGTQGLYSFAVGFLCFDALVAERFLVVAACGIITGIACLFSGWWQGVVCAAGIKSINQDKMGMGQAMLLAVFPEFYAILAFAFSALLLFVLKT